MLSTQDYLNKALHNLEFVRSLSQDTSGFYDWQVTGLFYSAVHLMNFHIMSVTGHNCGDHTEREKHLSGNSALPASEISYDLYAHYKAMRDYSEAGRYMTSRVDNASQPNIKSKIVSKSLKSLDQLMQFVDKKYSVSLPNTALKCAYLTKINPGLVYFTHCEAIEDK